MATKRRKNNGWEYVIKRAKLLDKPIYLTFEDEVEGDAYVAKLEATLDRGTIPEELRGGSAGYTLLSELIKDYLVHAPVPDSDVSLLNVLYARIGNTRLKRISYEWVEIWIADMKSELNLKPGTIRHYVGALGRCFDWAGRRNVVELIMNPIRQLPKSYSKYSVRDAAQAEAYDDEHEAQEDTERDRRMEQEEEVRIRAVMNREKPEGRQRPLELKYQAAIETLFDLAVETAMRMREMYTLEVRQVDITRSTVFLEKTKNGNKRQVPLSSDAKRKLKEYMAMVKKGERGMDGFNFDGGFLFPWWEGEKETPKLTKKALQKTTILLSRQYARIFDAAGCSDLTFHDLRHEATSRFFERTTMSDFEIMKITGHSSTRMLRRYSNLRASNLAAKLW